MKKYYLISNSIHINKNIIDSLNINNNDNNIIILFNHSYPLQFIKNNNIILFVRETDNILTGIDNNLSYYKKVYFFISSEIEKFLDKFLLLDSLNINYEIIYIKNLIKEFHSEYPENNFPTCGFLSYIYLTNNKNYNANIENTFLVGFTGHHSNGNDYNGIEHNYNYEQKYYKNNGVILLHSKK